MHIAAANGLATSVEILLNKGADIWTKNAKSRTALLSCAGDDQIAECLELMLAQLIVTVSATAAANATPAVNGLGGSGGVGSGRGVVAIMKHQQNQTYTPLKPAGLIRSSNTTPRTGDRLHNHNHNHHQYPRATAAIAPMSSTTTTTTTTVIATTKTHNNQNHADTALSVTDIILNDVHMNPLGASSANLTLSNGSLNNLNSTLINNNDDDEFADSGEFIKANGSFDAYTIAAAAATAAVNIEISNNIETEFY